MQVVDLSEAQRPLYFCCLEDWSAPMREAGPHKEAWYDYYQTRGLRVKLAQDDEGRVGGMIQYLPIEHAPAQGTGLYFVLCIWVHGHRQGRGNFQGRGMGQALLRAAEEDVRALGGQGLAGWGLLIPVWMRASWFRRRGYTAVDRDGLRVLLWKPFTPEAQAPRWIRQQRPVPPGEERVAVRAFVSGWCPALNLVVERYRRAAQELGEAVTFEVVDTKERGVVDEWGVTDAVFVDGKEVRAGPPPDFEKIRARVRKAVKRRR